MRRYSENPDKPHFRQANLFFLTYYMIFSPINFAVQTFFLYLQISWVPFTKTISGHVKVKNIFYLSTNNKLKNLWQTKESIPLVTALLKVMRQ